MPRDRRLVLACARLPGVGRRRLYTLLERSATLGIATGDDFATFLRVKAADLRVAWTPADINLAWEAGGEMSDACRRRDWRLWAVGREGYPGDLLRLEDPPAALFVHGDPGDMTTPRVAIVGTREPTEWGVETARAFAAEATRLGAVVVSGLAWGIDTAAHDETVQRRGRTWAVLPSGLDLVVPESNRGLASRIVERGSLISEYLPGTKARPTFFVERDRLQAALARVVVVVETGPSGGTWHTIRAARAVGVMVCVALPAAAGATPDVSGLPIAQQGTFALAAEGARVVTPADLASLLGDHAPSGPPDEGPRQGSLFG